VNSSLVAIVRKRARECCEYCQLPQAHHRAEFEIDHIIASKHGGATTESNLALSCYSCNSYEGPNIGGIDPDTGKLSPLYHPRTDRWLDHFQWAGPTLLGRSAVGRATINVLAINHPDHVALRAELIAEGVFPPASGR
jgi:hypothetical protein